MIFKGIGLLLTAAKNVAAGHNMLLNIFEHIKCFLERLKIYINIPLTTATGMIELLGNIMAQVLSVLAISTKAMAECRIKKYIKTLVGLGGKKNIEDALQRLDMLTREEAMNVGARNLEVTHQVEKTIKVQMQHQSRDQLRKWLTPPDPSKNHNHACSMQHEGTATWFIEGTRFKEWKMNGSLLWIHGHRTRLFSYGSVDIN
ncbi:hypothetical protein BGW80DRAFT_181747 [Lactifluus volemus]|nr:hypothetical protein BGW80DRAFT_181747 [Lactifluus volemus]